MADFTNRREITSLARLTPVQIEQLRRCGEAYDGEDLPPGQRLPSETSDEESVLHGCELWDVAVDGASVYEAWFYRADSGSIFLTGTTEMVAQVIQFGLECSDGDREAELRTAMAKAGI
ncbi:hypothetical protein [Streptomyces sp. NPDC090445]|uniref:hypothetical protein n=1 Tax=Streptomyces sp. NPDC090445 TaxID=3365963 RepID=UPI0037F8386E